MTPKESLQQALMRNSDCVYIRSRVSEEDWDDALFAALQAFEARPQVENHRDFRERWRIGMKHAGIYDPLTYSFAMISKAVFKHLNKE